MGRERRSWARAAAAAAVGTIPLAGGFERFWNESFDRLNEYVQDLKQARQEEYR
jgi:hypothetical protein